MVIDGASTASWWKSAETETSTMNIYLYVAANTAASDLGSPG